MCVCVKALCLGRFVTAAMGTDTLPTMLFTQRDTIYSFLKIVFYFLTLQYCIGFAIYQNESATRVPYPEPSSLLPLHTIPLGHPSALALSIQYRAFKIIMFTAEIYCML